MFSERKKKQLEKKPIDAKNAKMAEMITKWCHISNCGRLDHNKNHEKNWHGEIKTKVFPFLGRARVKEKFLTNKYVVVML